ncbi:MAG: hypothetical protein ACP5NF_11785, partial [Thermoanaerobaculum sp.]
QRSGKLFGKPPLAGPTWLADEGSIPEGFCGLPRLPLSQPLQSPANFVPPLSWGSGLCLRGETPP